MFVSFLFFEAMTNKRKAVCQQESLYIMSRSRITPPPYYVGTAHRSHLESVKVRELTT